MQPMRHSTAAYSSWFRGGNSDYCFALAKGKECQERTSSDVHHFLEALFKVTELAAGANNDLGSCQ